MLLTQQPGRVVPVRWIHGLRDDLPGDAGPVAAACAARIRALEARYRAAAAEEA
ncbi:MAG: hypothetical protein H6828_09590 [Planctomycetes bacterium]|nr:hypothetical protein [Planctomycetota bacterium]